MARAFGATFAVLSWAFTAWWGSHRSASPRVLGRWSPGYAASVGAAALVSLALTLAVWFPTGRRILKRLGVAAAATVATLLLAEAAFRLLDPWGISYYETSFQLQRARIADPDLQFRNAPNRHVAAAGVEYDFNELGMRERPVGAKSAGEYRVLLLGDSVTMAWGVPFEDTPGIQLERAASARSGRSVRTLNAGVGGYNTVQELAFLRKFGEALEPDLVLLLYAGNDQEANEPLGDPQAAFTLAGRTPPEVMQRLAWRSWIWRAVLHWKRYARRAAAPPIDRGSEGWRASMASVRAIADECARRGVAFGLVFARWRRDPVFEALEADLAAAAREKGIVYEDALPWFGGRDLSVLRRSAVDGHLNREGNHLFGAGLDGFLARHSWPPP